MITDIPTAEEFQRAAANYLYLAWDMVTDLVFDHEQSVGYLSDQFPHAVQQWTAETEEYWAKSQVNLGNALGLVQQAMELALKGRIAAVSPFLLISSADMPTADGDGNVSFGACYTLDANELVRVHNVAATVPLPAEFKTFFEEVRKERNKLMHSVPRETYTSGNLIERVLKAATFLFVTPSASWAKQCLDMEDESRLAAVGGGDYTRNKVMRQFDIALRNLKPAEALRYVGFDKKKRSYLCPVCHYAANTDWEDDFPHLAQLRTKAATCTEISCVVCETLSEVTRESCNQEVWGIVEVDGLPVEKSAPCPANVISGEGVCLTCRQRQDEEE